MALTEQDIAQAINEALTNRAPEETKIQITVLWDADSEDVAYLDDTAVYAPARVIATTHKPGGYIAWGGEHIDTYLNVDQVLDVLPARLMQKALDHAAENLAAPD